MSSSSWGTPLWLGPGGPPPPVSVYLLCSARQCSVRSFQPEDDFWSALPFIPVFHSYLSTSIFISLFLSCPCMSLGHFCSRQSMLVISLLQEFKSNSLRWSKRFKRSNEDSTRSSKRFAILWTYSLFVSKASRNGVFIPKMAFPNFPVGRSGRLWNDTVLTFDISHFRFGLPNVLRSSKGKGSKSAKRKMQEADIEKENVPLQPAAPLSQVDNTRQQPPLLMPQQQQQQQQLRGSYRAVPPLASNRPIRNRNGLTVYSKYT